MPVRGYKTARDQFYCHLTILLFPFPLSVRTLNSGPIARIKIFQEYEFLDFTLWRYLLYATLFIFCITQVFEILLPFDDATYSTLSMKSQLSNSIVFILNKQKL